MSDDDEKMVDITPISAIQFSQSVFIALFNLLDKKGVLSMKEIGDALIAQVDDPSEADLDEAAAVCIRSLGAALVGAPKRDEP